MQLYELSRYGRVFLSEPAWCWAQVGSAFNANHFISFMGWRSNMKPSSSDYQACPVCGSDARFAYPHPDLEVWRCPQCSHAFTRVDSIHKSEDYSSEYYDKEHKNWFENPHYDLFKWISDEIPKDAKSVIDIGCGRGDFLRYLHKIRPGLELVGVDLSHNDAEPGISYIQGDIMEMDLERSFDAVVSLAAIEHLDNPLAFARRLKGLCAPNGVLAIMTVDESGLLYRLSRLARKLGFGFLFNRLYSAHHLNHFSVKSLKRLLGEAGLDVQRVLHHNTPLAAVDLPHQLNAIRWPVLAILWVIFLIGTLTSMSLSQTVIARAK